MLVLVLVLVLVPGVGVGLGPGNKMILIQQTVERRDLGTAITGVRFVETLGTSVAATTFAVLFAAMTAHGRLGPVHVMDALHVIFGVGAVLLAVATVIATRLPASQAVNTADGKLGRAEQVVYYAIIGQMRTGTPIGGLTGQPAAAIAGV